MQEALDAQVGVAEYIDNVTSTEKLAAKVLTTGQTVVVFAETLGAEPYFRVNGDSVDNTLLSEGTDYTLDLPNRTVTLAESYPAGTIISAYGLCIGPRINAAGRMDFPEDALATLNTDCRRSAGELAKKLDRYNRQRQEHESLIRREATEQLSGGFDPAKDPVIVIGSRSWHHGVVGIVASRLMRQYHKPTFVIAIDAEGVGKGSGRSIEGVSLVDAIRACEGYLIAGGGHAMAAGLSIREKNMDRFRANFAEYVLANTSEEDRRPRLIYDAEIGFSQLSLDFLASYELLQPFGNANPQPVFVSRNVGLSRPPFHMKNNHLRLMLRQGYHEQDAVFFGGGEHELPEPPWDIAFTIDRNTYRGKTSLQIIIQGVKAAVAP